MALLFFLCGAILLAGLLTAMPARADGGIAISGSFSSQIFEIPQGSSVGGPSINVVVFNQSSTQINVTMVTEAPAGVTIDLSYTNFALQPGEYRQVQIGVAVSPDVPPGQYQISVTAQASYEGAGGVQVLPAAGETASLVVTGEAASVTVDTVGPSREPVVAVIRLFKVINGSNYEVSYSNTGHLEARVSPGSFVVSAYSNGDKLAEQSFDVIANEEKSLTLTVETVYFEGFRITPAYHTQTHELGYVQIAYTLTNVYQPMANAEVRLVVTLNGASLEEVSLLTQNPLDVGSIGVPYHYVPAWGWEKGTYGFSLQLYVDNQLYAFTTEQTLEVGVARASRSWMWIIIAIIGGGLGLLGLGVLVLRRRKRGGRPAKVEKRRQPAIAGKETGVAGVFARRGILDADDSFKMKPAAARPGGNGKGTSLAKATGVEKEKAGLSAAGILKKIKVWERFRKKGGGNGHEGGERPAGGQQPAGKQANVAGTTGVAKSAPPAAAGGMPRQSNIVKEAAMRKPSSPAAGNAAKEGVAKQAGVSKTPDVAKQTPPAVAGGQHKESDALKAADIQKQYPAISNAAKGNVATQATGAVKETTGVSKVVETRKPHTGPNVSDIVKEYVPPQSTSDVKASGAPKTARVGKEAAAHAPGGAGKESAGGKPAGIGKESTGGEASGDSRKSGDGAQVSKDKDKKPVPPIRFMNR